MSVKKDLRNFDLKSLDNFIISMSKDNAVNFVDLDDDHKQLFRIVVLFYLVNKYLNFTFGGCIDVSKKR